eukprot:comp6104_c0_seq1/m.1938 comp6104_c0_seq1/g.1938  ORF comp6104_c0_seq1/g.1938 comp6104_c0_seq1/m.1938 type:complete len:212 (-) comp6104_c0_seq1:21-656(-)
MPLGSWLQSDTTRCPHCRGHGRIKKPSQTSELTSLIPTSDRRLKPRRTKLWAALSVTFTAMVIALFVFFLYPRSVKIDFGPLETLSVSIDDLPLNITIKQTIFITNSNYVAVTISPLSMSVYFYTLLTAVANVTELLVPSRSRAEVAFIIDVGHNITGEYVSRVRRNCQEPTSEPKEINMEFQVAGMAQFLSQEHNLIIDDIVYLNCTQVK